MDSSGEDDDSHRYSPSAQDIQDFINLFLDGDRRHQGHALDDPLNALRVSRAPHNTAKPQTPISPGSPRRQASLAILVRRVIAISRSRRSRGGLRPAANHLNAGAGDQNRAHNQINRAPSGMPSRFSRAQQRRFDSYVRQRSVLQKEIAGYGIRDSAGRIRR